MSRAIISVLGGPGSGKTSQSAALAGSLEGYTHLSVGQALKAEAEGGGEHADEIKSCMAAGTLVPSATVTAVLQRLLDASEGTVLLDGFPRVQEQVATAGALGDFKGVLFLDAPEEVLVERLSREDCPDEIALIAQFTEHCLPVLDDFDSEGLVQRIDASASIEDVQAAMAAELKALMEPAAPEAEAELPAAVALFFDGTPVVSKKDELAALYADEFTISFVGEFTKGTPVEGMSMDKAKAMGAMGNLAASFPDLTFNPTKETPEKNAEGGWGAKITVTGKHTGAAFTPMPGKLPAIETTDKECTIGPELFTMYANEEGKATRLEIQPLHEGALVGPPGFYVLVGGSLAPPAPEKAEEPAAAAEEDAGPGPEEFAVRTWPLANVFSRCAALPHFLTPMAAVRRRPTCSRSRSSRRSAA